MTMSILALIMEPIHKDKRTMLVVIPDPSLVTVDTQHLLNLPIPEGVRSVVAIEGIRLAYGNSG